MTPLDLVCAIPPNWPFRAADIEAVTGMKYHTVKLAIIRAEAAIPGFEVRPTARPTVIMMVQFRIYRTLVDMGLSAQQAIVLAMHNEMDQAIRSAIGYFFITQVFAVIARKDDTPNKPLDFWVTKTETPDAMNKLFFNLGTEHLDSTSFRLINISKIAENTYQTIARLFPECGTLNKTRDEA